MPVEHPTGGPKCREALASMSRAPPCPPSAESPDGRAAGAGRGDRPHALHRQHRRPSLGGTPKDPNLVSAFLNIRVADIQQVYEAWSANGAEFLTPPQQRETEIRCYMRDPDGHLIEVGQRTVTPS